MLHVNNITKSGYACQVLAPVLNTVLMEVYKALKVITKSTGRMVIKANGLKFQILPWDS